MYLLESNTLKSAYIESHATIRGSVIDATIGIIGIILTGIITYFISKKQMSNSTSAAKDHILDSNKNLEESITRNRKDFYNNLLYYHNYIKINKIIANILNSLIDSLNIHDHILDLLTFVRGGMSYKSRYFQHIQNRCIEDLTNFDNPNYVTYSLLEWGVISDSMHSLMKSAGLKNKFIFKDLPKLFIILEIYETHLEWELDFIKSDNFIFSKIMNKHKLKYFQKSYAINDKIISTCKKLLISLNEANSFNPYGNQQDKDIARRSKQILSHI